MFIASLIPIGRAAGIIGKVLEHIPFARALAPLLHGLESAGSAVEKPVFGLLKKIVAPFGKLLDLIAAPFKRVGVFLLKEGEDALVRAWHAGSVSAGGRRSPGGSAG